MNCIIVDDQESARLVVRQLCEGINDLDIIEEFSSAIEAIKFLNQQSVDVIFLDIHMPGFSGFDFVQTLKSAAQIVLITCR
jgi:two-component SAPR family response regulator